MKIKTNKVSLKCLLKTATKTLVLRKLQRRKLALSKNINPKNYKTISDKSCFNAFAVSNNELIEVTKNEEINEKITFGNNPQKNESGVKEDLMMPSQKITLGLKTSKQFLVIKSMWV